jgi:hypothetical protein
MELELGENKVCNAVIQGIERVKNYNPIVLVFKRFLILILGSEEQ